MKNVIALLLALLLFPIHVSANSIDFVNTGLECVVDYAPVSSVSVDNFLLVGTQNDGLIVYDISNPLSPEQVGTCQEFTGNRTMLYVLDNYLYATSAWSSPTVFDLSNLPEVTHLGTLPFQVNCILNHHSGEGYLVSRTYGEDYVIYEVGPDPLNPDVFTTIGVNDLWVGEVVAAPNFLVSSYTTGGINAVTRYRLVDVTDLLNPIIHPVHESYAGDYGPFGFYTHGNVYYVVDSNGIGIWDLETLDYMGNIFYGSQLVGDYIVSAYHNFATSIYELSDPLFPTEIAVIGREMRFICNNPIYNNYIYQSNTFLATEWLDAIDLSTPGDPVIHPSGMINDNMQLAVSNGTTTVSMSRYGSCVVSDFMNGDVEEVILPGSVNASDMLLVNDYLYVSHIYHSLGGYPTGILVFDVSNPNDPELVDIVETGISTFYYKIVSNGTYLFLEDDDAIQVFNIADPYDVEYENELVMNYEQNSYIKVDDDILYRVSTDFGQRFLRVYDISDLNDIQIINTVADRLPSVEQRNLVIADNGRLFTPWDEGGSAALVLLDATDPANLIIAHTFEDVDLENDEVAIAVNGDQLFVGTEDDFQLYDVSDIYNPRILAEGEVYGDPLSCTASDGHAFLLGTTDLYHYTYEVDEAALTVQLVTYETELPLEGGTIICDAQISNLTANVLEADVWATVREPNGDTYVGYQTTVDLDPNATETVEGIFVEIPAESPEGQYVLTVEFGDYSDSTAASSSFPFEKTLVSTVQEQTSSLPLQYRMSPSYPNPFNAMTQFTFDLPEPGELSIAVYNVAGQQVEVITDRMYSAGRYTFTFDASGLASGLYFVQADVSERFTQVQKVMLVR